MTYTRMSHTIQRVETVVAGFCLVTSTVLIFFAAVVRSFRRPINWSVDISLFLFAWAVFFSADVAFRHSNLVSLDFLHEVLPAPVSRWLRAALYSVIIVFLGALVYFGVILAHRSRARAFQGIPQISYSWISLSLPVGALLILRSALEKLAELFRPRETPGDNQEAASA